MEPDVIRKRQAHHNKPRTQHPYAAIHHRALDSQAYADLSFSARSLLVLLTRQLTRTNNGHLQASFAWCKRYGFGSENTLRNAIAELISHGFIYRSRSHGANGAWACYAVTWLPITEREGLFLDGYTDCAWRYWEPPQEKSTPQKMMERSIKKRSFTLKIPSKTDGTTPSKIAAYELMPNRDVVAAHKRHLKTSIGDVLAPKDSEALDERLEVICE